MVDTQNSDHLFPPYWDVWYSIGTTKSIRILINSLKLLLVEDKLCSAGCKITPIFLKIYITCLK